MLNLVQGQIFTVSLVTIFMNSTVWSRDSDSVGKVVTSQGVVTFVCVISVVLQHLICIVEFVCVMCCLRQLFMCVAG